MEEEVLEESAGPSGDDDRGREPYLDLTPPPPPPPHPHPPTTTTTTTPKHRCSEKRLRTVVRKSTSYALRAPYRVRVASADPSVSR